MTCIDSFVVPYKEVVGSNLIKHSADPGIVGTEPNSMKHTFTYIFIDRMTIKTANFDNSPAGLTINKVYF